MFKRKSDISHIITFSAPKCFSDIALASPIVPQPNTTNFLPCFGCARLAALHPTVNGSIRQATLSEIESSILYKE